jgi:TPR repeat protein
MTRKILNSGADAEELFRDAEQKEDRGDLHGALGSHLLAAKLGNVLSQLALGNFYAAGRGAKKNLQEAKRWYKRAYRNGVSAGAINLAVDLQKQGNARNAIAWLKRAAAMNDGDACVRLAKVYLQRRNGTNTAVEFLRKAVSLTSSNISDEAREQAQALLKKADKASKSWPGSGSPHLTSKAG